MYETQRNNHYDFQGERYSSRFPNLHKYPATMLPQIGMALFKELEIPCRRRLLDPYCGTGSSALAGIASGFEEFHGFDINPLAVLAAKAKYTKLNIDKLFHCRERIKQLVCSARGAAPPPPPVTNIDFWFSKKTIEKLSALRRFIRKGASNQKYQALFQLAFSETARFVSWTRKSEFKLHRMPEEERTVFKPDVFSLYFKNLDKILTVYKTVYLPLLKAQKFYFHNRPFVFKKDQYDAVLTSPPYGDSRTTVAYGQFSAFSNEWLGFAGARKIDSLLMGGKKAKILYNKGLLSSFIKKISRVDSKRALEVSSFYTDLENSVQEVAQALKPGGFSVYVAGNRTVKNITLPTDQFIAEQFEQKGFQHILTYERALSSKSMPLKNSPTNIAGKKAKTMHREYIIVCRKR